MTQLPRYSIKVDASAAGVQVGMAADPAGEYVRVDELQFFVTQFFGKQAMAEPVAVVDPQPAEEFDPSNPPIRQIPESAKPGSGRQVSWS